MSAEHPEELLDRVRARRASAAELERFRAHAAACVACRLELRLLEDARVAGAARSGDALLIARIRRSTTRQLVARSLRRGAGGRRHRAVWLLAAAVTVAALATGATLRRALFIGQPLQSATEPARPLLSTPVPRAAVAPSASGGTVATPSAGLEPGRAAERAPRSLPRAPEQSAHNAAELFSEANRARSDGRVRDAIRLYRQLQQRFPGTAEARVSRVSLGRVLLDRAGQPRGALVQFDSYLSQASDTALRQEALVGRALALERLGRSADELKAWRALLAAYPSTSYAARARTRVQALSSDGDAEPATPP